MYRDSLLFPRSMRDSCAEAQSPRRGHWPSALQLEALQLLAAYRSRSQPSPSQCFRQAVLTAKPARVTGLVDDLVDVLVADLARVGFVALRAAGNLDVAQRDA